MDDIKLAQILNGSVADVTTPNSSKSSVLPANNTTTITAQAQDDSLDGYVTIQIDGENVEVPTTFAVKKGDDCLVSITNKNPIVTGVIGNGDKQNQDIEQAYSSATTANENSTTALNTANEANSNASTALSAANTADSKATTAQTTAEQAQTAANTASSNASTALSTANTANSNANSALNAAEAAQESVDDLTSHFWHDEQGVHVSADETVGTNTQNILIDSDSVDIKRGANVVASFGANSIEIGKNNQSSVIDFLNGAGYIRSNYGNMIIGSDSGVSVGTALAEYRGYASMSTLEIMPNLQAVDYGQNPMPQTALSGGYYKEGEGFKNAMVLLGVDETDTSYCDIHADKFLYNGLPFSGGGSTAGVTDILFQSSTTYSNSTTATNIQLAKSVFGYENVYFTFRPAADSGGGGERFTFAVTGIELLNQLNDTSTYGGRREFDIIRGSQFVNVNCYFDTDGKTMHFWRVNYSGWSHVYLDSVIGISGGGTSGQSPYAGLTQVWQFSEKDYGDTSIWSNPGSSWNGWGFGTVAKGNDFSQYFEFGSDKSIIKFKKAGNYRISAQVTFFSKDSGVGYGYGVGLFTGSTSTSSTSGYTTEHVSSFSQAYWNNNFSTSFINTVESVSAGQTLCLKVLGFTSDIYIGMQFSRVVIEYLGDGTNVPANLWSKLWEGSVTNGGSITVNNLPLYKLLGVRISNSSTANVWNLMMIGVATPCNNPTAVHFMGSYDDGTSYTTRASFSIDGTTLTCNHASQHKVDGSSGIQLRIREVWGLM